MRTSSQTVTTARAEISRSNGKKSVGPVSTAGKTVASMNGVQHGLASRSVLLPSETTTEYEANVSAWAATLHPSSPGEIEMVARVADLNFRLRRLQRLEDKHLTASLETKLKGTGVFRMLGIAQNASLGMSAMIATAADIKVACSGGHLSKLLSPIGAVMDMVEAADLPVVVTVPLANLHEELKALAGTELVPVDVFTRLSEIGRAVVEALDTKIAELGMKVVAEREHIADDFLLGDDKELKKFDRHRAAINKSLDAELARLKVVRELGQGGSGSSVGPFLIELKLIGRRE